MKMTTGRLSAPKANPSQTPFLWKTLKRAPINTPGMLSLGENLLNQIIGSSKLFPKL